MSGPMKIADSIALTQPHLEVMHLLILQIPAFKNTCSIFHALKSGVRQRRSLSLSSTGISLITNPFSVAAQCLRKSKVPILHIVILGSVCYLDLKRAPRVNPWSTKILTSPGLRS